MGKRGTFSYTVPDNKHWLLKDIPAGCAISVSKSGETLIFARNFFIFPPDFGKVYFTVASGAAQMSVSAPMVLTKNSYITITCTGDDPDFIINEYDDDK
jgi:hypothetical protein